MELKNVRICYSEVKTIPDVSPGSYSQNISYTEYTFIFLLIFVYPIINNLISILNYSFIHCLMVVNGTDGCGISSSYLPQLFTVPVLVVVGVFAFGSTAFCSVYRRRCEQRNSSVSARCQDRRDERWWKQIAYINSCCRSAVSLSGD